MWIGLIVSPKIISIIVIFNMSPAFTYAKPFIKLPLEEADEGSLKLTN